MRFPTCLSVLVFICWFACNSFALSLTSSGYRVSNTCLTATSFLGNTVVEQGVSPERSQFRSGTKAQLYMRKQKASDRKTRRRQAGLLSDESFSMSSSSSSTATTTITTSPMDSASWSNNKKRLIKNTIRPSRQTGGRGRSRKRSNVYHALEFYHQHFLKHLTAEYQAEEQEVLNRLKASLDDPLGLENAGYALYDMYSERRGNLYTDEVYRLTKATDATTIYPRSMDNGVEENDKNNNNNNARYLPPNHKFTTNDVIMLTLQPAGSGDFFTAETLPAVSDAAVSVEARVLNIGPTYVDVAMSPGTFEAAFGPAPNDINSTTKNTGLRIRADRFFSNIPYQRMVEALSQITTIPENQSNKQKNNIPENDDAKGSSLDKISMDEVLRDVILSTHAFTDHRSPLFKNPSVCNLEEVSNKVGKPPMASSQKLASQVLKYMKSNPHGIFPNFNAPQRAAIDAALTRRLTMIQGPPGTGKTACASAIGFGFVHQCRSLSPNTKVLACAFSNVGADNLAEGLIKLGLKVIRIGKPSAVTESLWENTLDAAIDRDPDAQKAVRKAAIATAQLSKLNQRRKNKNSSTSSIPLSERTIRDAATMAVKASIEASNIAASKALREADVIVSTSTGAADPRLLAACGILTKSEKEDIKQSDSSTSERVNAPDGLPPLSLPFVIIDEACQSVEPASLIPVIASNSCRALVMLGDPCQLPPTIRSQDAQPLSVSLMERLAATLHSPARGGQQFDKTIKDETYLQSRPVQQAMSLVRARSKSPLEETDLRQQSSYRKIFNGSLLLSIQYRMHPSIAALPSAIFYNQLLATPKFMNDIRAFPPALRESMPCSDPFQSVRFIDVGGSHNERRGKPSKYTTTVFRSASSTVDSDSPLEEQTSYWNEPEARRVIDLIKEVVSNQASSPNVKSIGVITPYNAQVQLIKSMISGDVELREMLMKMPVSIEVKSVDGYQGRERDLVIFSAVRSNRQQRIGFLNDWRRMNVALTRARSGLIIVGDIETLSSADKHWDALAKWANGEGCVVH